MTRRRWIADIWNETTATLSGAQAAHVAKVLRAQPGMEFDIVVGEQVRRGVLSTASVDTVEFTLGEEVEANPALPLTLLLAVFKFDRMEWAIEKATELGVERIVPVIARRTEKHLAQAATARVERWRRIGREAAQQSRRSDVVIVNDPIAIKDAIQEEPDASRLVLAEQERTTTLRDALQDFAAVSSSSQHLRIAVGPEGGWTVEESTLFSTERWTPVSLGPRILRAETAAISAVSIAAALLN